MQTANTLGNNISHDKVTDIETAYVQKVQKTVETLTIQYFF